MLERERGREGESSNMISFFFKRKEGCPKNGAPMPLEKELMKYSGGMARATNARLLHD